MTEKLFQFIWQFQYYNGKDLVTTDGETLQVLSAGKLNTGQGPDFCEARIKMGDTVWAGSVELHIRSSDWFRHGHQSDENYKAVILHVVWEHDGFETNSAVLELKERVSRLMLNRYETLMHSASFIPCGKTISSIPHINWLSWVERLIAERLTRKSGTVETFLDQTHGHWEEIFWWMLSRNFGAKSNADAFEAVARSIPLTLITKHKHQVLHLEALLMGQANLLHSSHQDEYAKLLFREYRFLKKKYGLLPVFQPVYFLRMRPSNFPTVRLAQLASLISQSTHLFSRIKEAGKLEEVCSWFDVQANDYWHYHYLFDTGSAYKIKKLGRQMIENIMVNTVLPVLFAYGHSNDEPQYKEKAIRWLFELGPEENRIIKGYEKLGVRIKSAGESQALLELKKEYCDRKRCLECAVGNYLLKEN